ncbi:hypothetical protein [Bacillus sp. EAC]|uniref:hypothetical protein n=1 Tax=Bacillus sp. EAC TaxID=1978338 RepID=UPI0015C504B1|nr:hypothetical protein [Bacillus sp. EAC]
MNQSTFKYYVSLLLTPLSIFCIFMGIMDKNLQIALLPIPFQLFGFIFDKVVYGNESK